MPEPTKPGDRQVEENLFLLFTKPFDQEQIGYMVTGSVAVIIYGEPRLTHDVDLVVLLREGEVNKLLLAFPLADFYCPPEEVLRIELARRQGGHFNLIHHQSGFKADVYLMGDEPLHRWAFKNRRQIDISLDSIWVAPPEYVIIRKLEYFRDGGSQKHLIDIGHIFRHSKDLIDQDTLMQFISTRGLQRSWEIVCAQPNR